MFVGRALNSPDLRSLPHLSFATHPAQLYQTDRVRFEEKAAKSAAVMASPSVLANLADPVVAVVGTPSDMRGCLSVRVTFHSVPLASNQLLHGLVRLVTNLVSACLGLPADRNHTNTHTHLPFCATHRAIDQPTGDPTDKYIAIRDELLEAVAAHTAKISAEHEADDALAHKRTRRFLGDFVHVGDAVPRRRCLSPHTSRHSFEVTTAYHCIPPHPLRLLSIT